MRHDAWLFVREIDLVIGARSALPGLATLAPWLLASRALGLIGETLFLCQAGAPLNNNLCERALKRAIRQRKNSMFYKTLQGAQVGDIYMSLISTCELCGINQFNYLQTLQRHARDVMATPPLWLPWNYHEQLPHAAQTTAPGQGQARFLCRQAQRSPRRRSVSLPGITSHQQQLQITRLQHARRLLSLRPEGKFVAG